VPQIKVSDSIKNSGFSQDTSLGPSIFKGHELQPVHQKPVLHLTNYDYLVALVLFISFCVFVWLYIANAKRLNQLFKSFSPNRTNQLSRDEYSGSNRTGLFLSLLFLFSITLFTGQVLEFYGLTSRGDHTFMYLFIAGALLIMYLVKFIFIRLSGFIFKTGKEALDYSSALFVFINILGLIMLPVVICLEFAKQANPRIFIYAGFFFIVSFLALRLLRGIVIGVNSNRVSKFYLFLYLCTLEIIPFVILVKLFMLYVY
jgi:hypothetical protein